MHPWINGWDWFLLNAAAVLMITFLGTVVYLAVQILIRVLHHGGHRHDERHRHSTAAL